MAYYRQSIEKFSLKPKPIYDILSLPTEDFSKSNHKLKKAKGQKCSSEPLLWSNDHANIISELIEELKYPKAVPYSDFTKAFIVHCDASENGLGSSVISRNSP